MVLLRVYELAGILGLLQQDPENSYKRALTMMKSQKVEALIKQRNQGRAAKDWAAADAARNELTAMELC